MLSNHGSWFFPNMESQSTTRTIGALRPNAHHVSSIDHSFLETASRYMVHLLASAITCLVVFLLPRFLLIHPRSLGVKSVSQGCDTSENPSVERHTGQGQSRHMVVQSNPILLTPGLLVHGPLGNKPRGPLGSLPLCQEPHPATPEAKPRVGLPIHPSGALAAAVRTAVTQQAAG